VIGWFTSSPLYVIGTQCWTNYFNSECKRLRYGSFTLKVSKVIDYLSCCVIEFRFYLGNLVFIIRLLNIVLIIYFTDIMDVDWRNVSNVWKLFFYFTYFTDVSYIFKQRPAVLPSSTTQFYKLVCWYVIG